MTLSGLANIPIFNTHTYNLSFYLEEGFLHLQNAVSMSIIERLANRTIDLRVSVQVSALCRCCERRNNLKL